MVSKNFISLSLLLTVTPSFMQCAAAAKAGIIVEKNSKKAEAPAAAAAASSASETTTTTTVPATASTTNQTLTIGQPYPAVVIDPAKQTESFE